VWPPRNPTNLCPANYTLTVTKSGTGSGTIISGPSGINCGPTCSANYNQGTSVTLTASPSSGSIFSGWSGSGCSGTGTCVVTMDAAKTVNADFGVNRPPTCVSISPNGIDICKGTAQTFTAAASDADGDILTYSWTSSAGTPSTSSATSFAWTAPSGVVSGIQIGLSVTDGKSPAVSCPTATVDSVTCVSSKPNLTVTSVTATPSTFDAGVSHSVGAVIKNAGDKDAGAFSATLYLDCDPSSQTCTSKGTWSITSLAAGTSLTLADKTGLTIATAGTHIYYVKVDSANVIDESNETDNVGSASVTVNTPTPIDRPPTAIISCDASGCQPGGQCGANWIAYNRNCIYKILNQSTDPDDNISKSIWSIFYQDGTPWQDPYLTCSGICDLTLPSLPVSNFYEVKLKVEDTGGLSSSITHSFYVRQDAIADFECSLNGTNWKNCQGFKVPEDVVVYFRSVDGTRLSIPSEGASSITSFHWTFEDGTPSRSTLQKPLVNFKKVDANSGNITLIITDNVGRTDTQTYHLFITSHLPEWREVPPL